MPTIGRFLHRTLISWNVRLNAFGPWSMTCAWQLLRANRGCGPLDKIWERSWRISPSKGRASHYAWWPWIWVVMSHTARRSTSSLPRNELPKSNVSWRRYRRKSCLKPTKPKWPDSCRNLWLAMARNLLTIPRPILRTWGHMLAGLLADVEVVSTHILLWLRQMMHATRSSCLLSGNVVSGENSFRSFPSIACLSSNGQQERRFVLVQQLCFDALLQTLVGIVMNMVWSYTSGVGRLIGWILPDASSRRWLKCPGIFKHVQKLHPGRISILSALICLWSEVPWRT